MYDKGRDYVLAHMWFNLAAALPRDMVNRAAAKWIVENAAKNRDIVAEKMTPAQVAEAQRLAREWLEKHQAEKRPRSSNGMPHGI